MKIPFLALLSGVIPLAIGAEVPPVVEVEEEVYTFTDAGNGAGPMWCSGSTTLVRHGEDVFVSGLETVAGAVPLNNCRWVLYRRSARGWERLRVDDALTREPAPLAVLQDGWVLVSVNPTEGSGPQPKGGAARPDVLQFSAKDPRAPPEALQPRWAGAPRFTEHSYRSFAADGAAGEVVLFQNIGYAQAEWTLRDAAGQWSRQGQLAWPWAAEYDQPQPVRICYPNVALRGRAVYFCGVSDVVEPYRAWRDFKRQATGREWDYDFRRLFFTWTPELGRAPFAPWIEIASRDRTAGWITPGDLWVAPDGAVHLLWAERALDERLRARFFPEERQSHALNHAVVRDGKVVAKQTLVESTEDRPGVIASGGRFHATPDHRLYVVYFAAGKDAAGQRIAENRLCELRPDGRAGTELRLPLSRPLRNFFTATVRAGSAPSDWLDLLGQPMNSSNSIRYARVRLR